jgi:hypothetical protein
MLANMESINPREKDYRFFQHFEERQELFDYSKAIGEYLKTQGITNLVIIDRSARPLYIGVREYLSLKYPNEPKPNIYFVNPKGFKVSEELTDGEIEEIINDCNWKGDVHEGEEFVKTHEDIAREFSNMYKRLINDRDKPVLIFDTCIHRGRTLAPVKKIFKESGFSDVRIGSINPAENGSMVKHDFYITEKTPRKLCYPFDYDRIVNKTFNHVYSKPTKNYYQKIRSFELRGEIKRIVNEFISTETRRE